MHLTFPSLIASALSLTILTGILYFLMRKDKILTHAGIISAYIFSILILLRGCLPFEFTAFHITKTYLSTKIIPGVQEFVGLKMIPGKFFPVTILSALLFVWILVGFFLLLKKLRGYYIYRKRLHNMNCCPPQNINAAYKSACRAVFPNKEITCKIVMTDNIPTPAVFGVVNKIIIIPNIYYTDRELFYIFAHELLHIKHRDFLIKFISDVIQTVYWWNPVISLLLPSLLKQLQELYVDYSVTNTLKKNDTLLYLNCLRKTAVNSCKNPESVYAFCDNSSKDKLRQRLIFIMKKKAKGISVASTAITLSLVLLSFTFVFEASNCSKYDENGDRVFYFDESNSYYVKKGTEYDLYLNGEFVYTTPVIIDDFKNIPVYNKKP